MKIFLLYPIHLSTYEIKKILRTIISVFIDICILKNNFSKIRNRLFMNDYINSNFFKIYLQDILKTLLVKATFVDYIHTHTHIYIYIYILLLHNYIKLCKCIFHTNTYVHI